ncbi:CocE/NonD family hydrolase [Ilumatobacter sp.]|uniref:CocE/NonD family hydrolase n=1 Tax=Ilumatobacter sp. TaxID=1967498 RepID=UPI0037527286
MEQSSVWITVGNGHGIGNGHGVQRLAGTLYRPDDSRGPFATLVEALPYRKDDVTDSYSSTYRRYVESDFAVLRVDLRGTGSSTGVLTDEYPDAERSDLGDVIEWIVSQPWSTGRVGMFGTSYSGFNSLQMATEGIDALGAVVAIYATDDRYTDDVHYAGGVLRAIDLIDYPLYMVAMNALPPVPALTDGGRDGRDEWRDEWRRRIDETPPWLLTWLEHRDDDDTWRRGSIRTGPDGAGYERMSCPTMLVAGWADGYRNNTFRVVEQYERIGLPWRMIAGPWVHKSPEHARPGPNIDDDAEILAFFDEHLRHGPPHVGAPGQIYVRQPVAPEPDLRFQPGRWCDWPDSSVTTERWPSPKTGIDSLAVSGDVGLAAWNSCGGGLPWGQPLDQRLDDARSITHDWLITEHRELLGTVTARFHVRSDQPYGYVSVKLCDVFADGTSALITRGVLDLSHVGCWPADPRGEVGRAPASPIPGEWIDVAIDLESTTWTLLPGHTLRLSIAGSDWPNCWPPPGPLTVAVDAESVYLDLPLASPDRAGSTHDFRVTPGLSDDDAAEELGGAHWVTHHDVLARESRVSTRYGGTYEGSHGAVITDDYAGELAVSTVDPAKAWARGTSTFEIVWPEATVRTRATLEIVSDSTDFTVSIDLVAHDGDDEFARRNWTATIPRTRSRSR